MRHFSQKWATCTPRAEHAPEGLVNPAVAWGTLGLHVVNAKGARGALEGGAVSAVVSRDLFLGWTLRTARGRAHHESDGGKPDA